MTTNSPNPVDGDVQALIADCQAEIAEIEKALTTWGDAWIPSLQSKLNRQQLALAALTAETVYQLIDDGKWYDAPKYLFDEANQRGDECRMVYTTPPAQLLRPVELPKSDGWIEWSGGDCPVFDYSLVETKWSSGAIVEDCAGEFDWSFEDGSCNIIAYRVVKS